MKLDGLAGGDAQGAIAVTVGERVQGQVLRAGEAAGRHAHTDHEAVFFFQPLLFQGGGGITVELLICSMEFQNVIAILRHLRAAGGELFGEAAAQAQAGCLEAFDARKLFPIGHREILCGFLQRTPGFHLVANLH